MSPSLFPVDFPRGEVPTLGPGQVAAPEVSSQHPHVVAWNLTQRCNLACGHCYISAGSWHSEAGELDTEQGHRIVHQILAVNPGVMLILSGGEPLLRTDLEELAEHATSGGATVVVGTNGTRLSDQRIRSLKDAGVRGVAISIDSLESSYHDRFRHGDGALSDTLGAVERLQAHELDFLVQTTVTRGNRDEIPRLVEWCAEQGAVSFNLYFLVATGRGEAMSGLSPDENDSVLRQLTDIQRDYRGRLMIRSKCQPQLMRHVHEQDPESPLLTYETRCPCGIHYCRITPEGKVTPCPYTPAVAGDLLEESFADIWWGSPLLKQLREGALGGKCGVCEYRELCGGCRARAYATSGDILAEDNSCAYEPTGEKPLVERAARIRYGTAHEATLSWSPEAEARIQRIPSFVRGVVMGRVEEYARKKGHGVITPELLDEVRRELPVDFSKRLPFFLRKDR